MIKSILFFPSKALVEMLLVFYNEIKLMINIIE